MTKVGPNPTPASARSTEATVAPSDETLYPPISPFEAEFESVKSGVSHIDGLALAGDAARIASVDMNALTGVNADVGKASARTGTTLGMVRKGLGSVADTKAGAVVATKIDSTKKVADRANARTGIVTNGVSAMSNAATFATTGDPTALVRAGSDTLNAGGAVYDTLSTKRPDANHWVVGSRLFAVASVVTVGRTTVQTLDAAGTYAADPTYENGRALTRESGKMLGATGGAAFVVKGAVDATAGAIAKKTGEEFATASAKVLPKHAGTVLNVAIKRAPILFAASDLARASVVSTDPNASTTKKVLAWVAVGGSTIATGGMLTANPVLIAAGGAVSLAAGTASDLVR